jgi:hypothetical protein
MVTASTAIVDNLTAALYQYPGARVRPLCPPLRSLDGKGRAPACDRPG